MTAIFSGLVAAFVTGNVVECIDACILDVGVSRVKVDYPCGVCLLRSWLFIPSFAS